MIDNLTKIIYILSFVLLFIAYSFFETIKEQYGIKIFYPFTALAFTGFTYSFYRQLEASNFKIFAEVVYLLALSNFIDEVFFDPTVMSVNEYVGFIIIVIISARKWRRN